MTLDYRKGDLAVNSISGLFPKENHEWIKWIQDGKAIRIDEKDKVLSRINSLRTNPEEAERIGLNLDSTAKIIKDFENPSISVENSSSDPKNSNDNIRKAQRSAAYIAYKGDMNRINNDSDLELGKVDFTTWRQRDNALRTKYSPSYMDFRYDKMGIAYDYSGLSALFDGSDWPREVFSIQLFSFFRDSYLF